MRYILKPFTIYEYGHRVDSAGNKHQEDTIFPDTKHINPSDRLFMVCDGMGGHDAGEVASATVCRAMSDYILKFDPNGPFTDENLAQALDAAYRALDAKDTGSVKKMGTTMTFLKFHDKGATIAHIGDSRVYQFRPGNTPEETQIVFVTEDHSLVNDLIKIGELTPEQARTSKQKNVITRAMQPGEERRCKADIYHTFDIKPGDWFYLCSDGMLEQATDENLKFIFSNASFKTGEEKRNALFQNSEHNDDNHSAILVEVKDVIDPISSNDMMVNNDSDMLEAIIDDDIPVTPAPIATPMHPVGGGNSTKKETANKGANKGLLWAIIALLVVILVGVCCYFFIVQPNSKTSTNEDEESGNAIENVDNTSSYDENYSAPSQINSPSEQNNQPQGEQRNPSAQPSKVKPAPSASKKIQEVVNSTGDKKNESQTKVDPKKPESPTQKQEPKQHTLDD